MVRVARDIEEITAEIMCSDFAFETLMEMSQMEIPTEAEQQQKIMAMQQQMQAMIMQAQQQMQQAQPGMPGAPGAQAAAQQNPEQAKQLEQQFMQLKGNLEDEHAEAYAGTRRAVPQGLPHHGVRARHRDGQHHSGQRGRREATTRRVHGHDGAADCRSLRRSSRRSRAPPSSAARCSSSPLRRSASAARSTAQWITWSSKWRRRPPR